MWLRLGLTQVGIFRSWEDEYVIIHVVIDGNSEDMRVSNMSLVKLFDVKKPMRLGIFTYAEHLFNQYDWRRLGFLFSLLMLNGIGCTHKMYYQSLSGSLTQEVIVLIIYCFEEDVLWQNKDCDPVRLKNVVTTFDTSV